MNVSGGQLSLGGYISTDAKGNAFYNYTRSPGGHLTVEQDGATVLDQDIGDYFYEEIGYVGTPATVVTIDGWSGQPLSTETHTVLSFVADPTIDHTPPYFVVGVVEPTGLDLYNAVAPTGDIQVGVFASDTESGVADVGLSFSLDDGITWHAAPITALGGDEYLANLGPLEDVLPSLLVQVTDNQGNARTHQVLRGFRVLSRLRSPEDGARKPPGDISFAWYEHAAGTGYHIQVDEVDTFDSPALVESDSIMNEHTFSLDPGSYWWRMKTYLDGTETPYTQPWRLHVVRPFRQVTSHLPGDYRPDMIRSANGDLWVAWHSFRSGNGDIWCKTSPDDGATWTAAAQVTTDTDYDYAPTLARASNGDTWVAWYSYRSGNADIWYKTSPDGGVSWSGATQLTADTGSDYSPTILQTSGGDLWVVWHSYRSGNADIWYRTSPDAGTTWSSPAQLTAAPEYDYYPDIAEMSDGTLWLVWERWGDTWYKTSGDSGQTWSVEAVLEEWAYGPGVVQNSDDDIWLTWYSYRSGNYDLWYKTSPDNGATWSDPMQFTRFTGYDGYPSVAPLADGNMAFAWQSDRAGGHNIWFGIPSVIEDSNPPPHVDWARNTPYPNPDSDEVVTIAAGVSDETGVTNAVLVWSVDDVAQADLQMYDDGTHGDAFAGDSIWTAQVGPFAVGSYVSYRVRLTDTDANTVLAPSWYPYWFQSLEPWVATADVLLVADDMYSWRIDDWVPVYQDALDSLEVTYDLWDASLRGVPDSTELPDYLGGMVVWAAPSWQSYLLYYTDTRETATAALGSYLDQGGSLFITGREIANYLAYDAFLSEYLRVGYAGYPGLYGVDGVADDPIGDGLAFDLNQSGTEIDPIAPAVPVFVYDPAATEPLALSEAAPDRGPKPYEHAEWQGPEATPEDGQPHPGPFDAVSEPVRTGIRVIWSSGTAGLRVDTGTYKLTYLAFGFEAIDSADGRNTLMGRAVNWLAPELLPSEESVCVELVGGWNIVALAAQPDPAYTASSLAGDINSQGGNVTQVFWWNAAAGTWDFYLVDVQYGTDFPIEVGYGYLLQNTVAADWCYDGVPLSADYTAVVEPVVTNVADKSFSVSWISQDAEEGYVEYGTSPGTLDQTSEDDRGAGTVDDTHQVTITGLTADTTYHFVVVSGGTIADSEGAAYQVTTGPGLAFNLPVVISGEVFLADGSTAAEGTIVYTRIGTDSSQMLSALVNDSGTWAMDIASVRTTDFQSYCSYTDADDITSNAQGAADGLGSQTVTVAEAKAGAPSMTVSLTAELELVISWNLIALPILPATTFTASTMAADINAQGGDITQVFWWNALAGTWDFWLVELSYGTDFAIEMGEGYLLGNVGSVVWQIQAD